jgi:hypothetical protein
VKLRNATTKYIPRPGHITLGTHHASQARCPADTGLSKSGAAEAVELVLASSSPAISAVTVVVVAVGRASLSALVTLVMLVTVVCGRGDKVGRNIEVVLCAEEDMLVGADGRPVALRRGLEMVDVLSLEELLQKREPMGADGWLQGGVVEVEVDCAAVTMAAPSAKMIVGSILGIVLWEMRVGEEVLADIFSFYSSTYEDIRCSHVRGRAWRVWNVGLGVST